MNAPGHRPPPRLEAPEIPGEQAEAEGLVWADAADGPDGAEPQATVPVHWVEDAVRGALAQYQDDIVDAVLEELQQRVEQRDDD